MKHCLYVIRYQHKLIIHSLVQSLSGYVARDFRNYAVISFTLKMTVSAPILKADMLHFFQLLSCLFCIRIYLTLVSVLFRNSHNGWRFCLLCLFSSLTCFFFWNLTGNLTIVCVVLLFYNLQSFNYLFILRIFSVLPSSLFCENYWLKWLH